MIDYVTEMRKIVGHIPLLTIGCGVIIENQNKDILLRKNFDNAWGIPGGRMNYCETFVETAKREVLDKTGLTVDSIDLFGIYSGEQSVVRYPNHDVAFGAFVIFKTNKYFGSIVDNHAFKFYSKNNLPENIEKSNKKWIEQWCNNSTVIVVD